MNLAETHAMLRTVLSENPEEVSLHALVVNEYARKNDKRPAKLGLFVEDDWVVNIVKNEKLRDFMCMVRVDGAIIDAYVKRIEEERKNGAGKGNHQRDEQVRAEGGGTEDDPRPNAAETDVLVAQGTEAEGAAAQD